ncbi:hypothetical protein CKAN_01337300 [Cinnamomum micranthum f. kanehirae]|uniref:Uncharacterized protein n=1 Tax=Cinnamomum micranthum f. kanehirae TaxID=337451 RepID=A0A443P195_9MAGN|nr:hypothetical protein CKAN_01337300 [Cinnamomum micranthum f. kanehirae]
MPSVAKMQFQPPKKKKVQHFLLNVMNLPGRLTDLDAVFRFVRATSVPNTLPLFLNFQNTLPGSELPQIEL